MKKNYSKTFILILLMLWLVLNFVVFPLVLNLSESNNVVNRYISIGLLFVITVGVIVNIVLYLKKSTIPYYISIPLIIVFFINIFAVIVSYKVGFWIILLFLQYGIPVMLILLFISVILGIYLEKRKCRE